MKDRLSCLAVRKGIERPFYHELQLEGYDHTWYLADMHIKRVSIQKRLCCAISASIFGIPCAKYPMYISAESLDFLDLTQNFSSLNWKLARARNLIYGWAPPNSGDTLRIFLFSLASGLRASIGGSKYAQLYPANHISPMGVRPFLVSVYSHLSPRSITWQENPHNYSGYLSHACFDHFAFHVPII